MHSDDTPGHERDCSITTLVNLYIYNKYQKNMMIYTLESFKNLLYVMVNLCDSDDTSGHEPDRSITTLVNLYIYIYITNIKRT